MDLATDFQLLNCDVVALCDNRPDRIEVGKTKINSDNLACYSDFDEFLNHDMDAVLIANHFHEHTPYIIKCFERNIHVYCECISNGTMAEGVELIRAFEKSKSIFMLAENYPQMQFNREIKRICDSGTLGDIVYAEGEYNHPVASTDSSFAQRFNYFEKHWRNYLPATYYITHSLGPIMWATGATPKRVTAFAACDSNKNDKAGIIMTHNDNGSVFRVTGCAGFGAHHNSYRVCGTKGQVENVRGMKKKVMLRYNEWDVPEGAEKESFYEPAWNDKDEDLIKASGHGGADYLSVRTFLDCIKAGKQPEHPFDVYSAVNMSSVAILAHRSALANGQPYDIPDFHLEECRKEYENDRLTPFYGPNDEEPTLPFLVNKK